MSDKIGEDARTTRRIRDDEKALLESVVIGKGNAISFAFWRGDSPGTPEQEHAMKQRGLEELEAFAKGEKPQDEKALKLHNALNKRSANIRLSIVTIDPNDKTTSFAKATRELHKFLPQSRDRFVSHALSHLKELDPNEGEFGLMYGLCHALVKARHDAGGTLGEQHEKMLESIRADMKSPAGKALRSAERRLSDRDGIDGGSSEKPVPRYAERIRDDRDAARNR